MEFEKVEKEHILQGIRDFEEKGIPKGFGPSSTYDLFYDGKVYPPKAVMAYANFHASGRKIERYFKGGLETDCFKKYEKLGFVINEKMASKDVFRSLLKQYKAIIANEGFKNEIYKWELLEKYQGRPDTNAENFIEEIKSIDFSNLLYHNARGVALHIVNEKPEEYRTQYKFLFDEAIPLQERIDVFTAKIETLYRNLDGAKDFSHHHDERTIATLLTYHNPEKYTFYKSSFYKKLCKQLEIRPKKAGKKYGHYLSLVHEFVNGHLKKDEDLLKKVSEKISQDYYRDPKHLLLAQDILYRTLELDIPFAQNELEKKFWLIAPGNDAIKWDEFYEEGEIALGWDDIGNISQYDNRDQIRTALINAYGGDGNKMNDTTANWEFANSISIGDVIIVKKGRNKLLGYGIVTSGYYWDKSKSEFKHRRKVKWQKRGVWDIEHNLVLKTLTDITPYPAKDQGFKYYYEWLLSIMDDKNKGTEFFKRKESPINTILFGPPGTGKTFYLKNQLFDKYTSKETLISLEQHFEAVVSGCSWWQVIAIALIEMGNSKVSEIFENEWVKKKASLSNSKTVRPTIWGQLQSHTIDECEFVNVSNRQQPLIFNKTKDSFWGILEDQVEILVPELYEIKDSVDNYSPNPDKIIKHYEFVTFHQSFAYEDFIEGIKPILPENGEESKDLGYVIENGVFKNLCLKAKNDPDNRYAIFIDEINRGNVSAIFGELITLIELDKRKGAKNEIAIKLPYSKKPFSVPSNIDIYGTMNTADRSVEALDTALRRRFEFKEMMPNLNVIADEVVDGISLSEILKTINERIELLIDRDHTIGHSYFINITTKKALANAFNNKIVPLLQEYFYGDYGKIGLVLGQGFVEKLKNDNINFASFNYDNANDFKTPTFILKRVTSDSIIDAVNILLAKKETVQNQ